MAAQDDTQVRRKTRVAALSVLSNSILVLAKLGIGLAIGSVSVISEAIHSGVDLVAAVVALISVRTSGRPADQGHPYGHGKIENISGTIEAVLIFVAAAWIVVEAVRKLMHATPLDTPLAGVVVMLVSAGANLLVSRRLLKVGEQTDSVALIADAWHLRTDVWTSAGVMAALLAVLIIRAAAPGTNVSWLDPVAAIAVALLIVRAAYHLLVSSGRDLMDASLVPDEDAWIRAYLDGLRPRILGYHDLRTRKAGPYRFVEVHLDVPADLRLDDAHATAAVVRDDIGEHFPGATVTVHMDPATADRMASGDDAPPPATRG